VRLELRGVTAGYGDTTVLRNVDLVVPDGAVVALLGANGAGKTTLLSVASGLLRPRSGSVLLDNTEGTGDAVDFARRGICHITDKRCIFPSLSVRENLRMFAPPGEEIEAIEMAVSAFPRLGERVQQTAGTLSGGEQQMLAVARAYVKRPSIILIDEVSMGLAPIIVDELFEFIKRVAETTSVLLVEQYIAKALNIADFVYILTKGRIGFQGEPWEVGSTDLLSDYLGPGVTNAV
jgi:branched-chain amino acid transport system ATP-binding protein